MKKLTAANNQKHPKQLLIVMVIILCAGNFIVLFNIIIGRHKPVVIEIEALKDSLLARQSTAKKSISLLSLMELYQEKQMLKSLQQKDSLNQKDIMAIKEIDQKLNNLMNDEN